MFFPHSQDWRRTTKCKQTKRKFIERSTKHYNRIKTIEIRMDLRFNAVSNWNVCHWVDTRTIITGGSGRTRDWLILDNFDCDTNLNKQIKTHDFRENDCIIFTLLLRIKRLCLWVWRTRCILSQLKRHWISEIDAEVNEIDGVNERKKITGETAST